MKIDKTIYIPIASVLVAIVLFVADTQHKNLVSQSHQDAEKTSSLTSLTLAEKTEGFFDERSELCENYKEIQDFKEPIPIIWEAKLTGCLMSCYGAHFTRIPETENFKYPRFSAYYPDEFGKYNWENEGNGGSQIPGKFLEDRLNLRIYGKWLGIDADHPYTVFGNKCVPFVEIEKIEIIK